MVLRILWSSGQLAWTGVESAKSTMSVTIKTLLSPKELADAIGASESSVRRWIDSGAIPVTKTAGGHRRILVAHALRYIRESGTVVARPELLGMEAAPSSDTKAQDIAYQALVDGAEDRLRSLVLWLYTGGMSPAVIFDQVLAPAMHRVGELWNHDEKGILIEHRAVDMHLRILMSLRLSLPATSPNAPIALGGAPPADPYLLPSLMCSVVLQSLGFRDMNYGPNTPLELLAAAAREHGARLVWVSASSPADRLARRLSQWASELAGVCPVVVGGRQIPQGLSGPNLVAVGSMAELEAFARGVLAMPGSTSGGAGGVGGVPSAGLGHSN